MEDTKYTIEYKKETKKEAFYYGMHVAHYTDDYVEWLEKKAKCLQEDIQDMWEDAAGIAI